MKFVIKLLISVCVISICAGIARKVPSLAGLIAVMPLTGLIVLVWLYLDNPGNFALMTDYAKGALWGIVPSILFFLVAFIGVAMIKGFDPRVSAVDLTLGVIAAASSGMAYNCIRKLAGREDPLGIILYFPLITVPIVGSYTLFHFVWPTWQEWGLLLLVGIFVQTAQYFMTRGLILDRASNVIHANYTGVLFSLAWGYLLFGEGLPPLALAGIGVVLTGVILAGRAGKSGEVQGRA